MKQLPAFLFGLISGTTLLQSPLFAAEAYFGGGCFWCVEALFEQVKGVDSVVSGYAGGNVPKPTYDEVSVGNTGHAEVIRVSYNPTIVTYSTLVHLFFHAHNPTTLNQQGADVGPQYRSAVFVKDTLESRIVTNAMANLATTDLWDKEPFVTEVKALRTFWRAEEYHQDYFARNPTKGYCQLVIAPKLRKFRKTFPDVLK